MKSLFLGILFILFVGIGGFMYRNAIEYSTRPTACQMDAKVCPNGTSVTRTGPSCTFPACPLPNVSLSDIGITFAVPDGFVASDLPDISSVATYEVPATSSISSATIIIRRYTIDASSTALETIQSTAIGGPSGLPVPTTAFSSKKLGSHSFIVVSIERFEAVINTAYYLARDSDVLRFDAIDRDVIDWMEPNLDISTLPANAALQKMLSTMGGV